jgi:preprotein translocase subunit SecG
MTRNKISQTLFETTGIGLLSGFVGGVLLYIAIMLKASEQARQMDVGGSASHLCSAGSAAFMLALLSIPAGTLFGLCLGGFFLWRKSVAARRPLP